VSLREYRKPSPGRIVPSSKGGRRLVILSIPFTRIARLLLADGVLEALLTNADVLVVSPHSNAERFRADFGRPGVSFFQFDPNDLYSNRVRAAVYALTELLRMRGFHRRFRKSITGAYWVIRHIIEGWNGVYTRKPWLLRVATSLAGLIGGSWPGAWRAVERVSGGWLFDLAELGSCTLSHDSVTLVQSACFGEQDRFLAFAARRFGFRTVLVPYTTDQLTINGYLMSDFDVVCLQSAWEAEFAGRFHGIRADRIRVIGNLWFRHIDQLIGSISVKPRAGDERVILLAGITTRVFPRASEFVAVDTILRAIEMGHLGRARLVYRPVVELEEDHAELIRRYGSHPSIELQIPQASCIGLLQYPERPLKTELQEYVSQLLGVDIVIMCFQTSICLDAAYLGRPVISYCADSSGMLQRPYTLRTLEDDLGRIRASGVPEVHSVDHLVPWIARVLADGDALQREGRLLVDAWDVQSTRSIDLLLEVLFPTSSPTSCGGSDMSTVAAGEATAQRQPS
jgi:hypothetical protein